LLLLYLRMELRSVRIEYVAMRDSNCIRYYKKAFLLFLLNTKRELTRAMNNKKKTKTLIKQKRNLY